MSVKVMSWVWDRSDSLGNERLVLLAIADDADHDGTNAWPSIATLAHKTRLSGRSVQRAIAALERLGELRVERNAGGTPTTRSDRRPNRYTVLMDGVTGCHPVKPAAAPPPGDDADTPRDPDGVSFCHPVDQERGDISDTPPAAHGVTDPAPRGDTADTRPVLDPSCTPPTPAERGSGLPTNPRALGTNPRALGTNPRGPKPDPEAQMVAQAHAAAAATAARHREHLARVDAEPGADPAPHVAAIRRALQETRR